MLGPNFLAIPFVETEDPLFHTGLKDVLVYLGIIMVILGVFSFYDYTKKLLKSRFSTKNDLIIFEKDMNVDL